MVNITHNRFVDVLGVYTLRRVQRLSQAACSDLMALYPVSDTELVRYVRGLIRTTGWTLRETKVVLAVMVTVYCPGVLS